MTKNRQFVQRSMKEFSRTVSHGGLFYYIYKFCISLKLMLTIQPSTIILEHDLLITITNIRDRATQTYSVLETRI